MTAKEYLKQTFKIDNIITAKKEQMQRLIDQLGGSGIQYKYDKVSTSSRPDQMAEMLTSLNVLQNLFVTDVTRLLRLKYDITILIDGIEDFDCRLVLFERYINLKDWKDVAFDNNLSWSTVHRLHSKALKQIDKKMQPTV